MNNRWLEEHVHVINLSTGVRQTILEAVQAALSAAQLDNQLPPRRRPQLHWSTDGVYQDHHRLLDRRRLGK
jgi:hypothetical protein